MMAAAGDAWRPVAQAKAYELVVERIEEQRAGPGEPGGVVE